jgi:hypothetical protein
MARSQRSLIPADELRRCGGTVFHGRNKGVREKATDYVLRKRRGEKTSQGKRTRSSPSHKACNSTFGSPNGAIKARWWP